MPKEFSRTSRIGETLQRELSIIIQKEMRDPRLGMITIIDVEVTKDLAQAKVYFSLLDENPDAIKLATKTLADAAGFLRTQLAQKVKLRTTPKLYFIYDESLTRGNKLTKLIDEAISKEPPPENRDSEELS